MLRAFIFGAVGASLVIVPPAAANASPVAPTPGPGDHVGQLLGGGNAPSEAQQPRDDAGGWVEHRGATGAQCMDRGVVCDTGIWYPTTCSGRAARTRVAAPNGFRCQTRLVPNVRTRV